MPERLIELNDIAKSYGRVFAVGGVNLHVDRGEVVGLIGDNGAGKSTLIKMLAGAIRPTSGEILVRGKVESNWNAARSRDAGIETVFQDRALCVQQTIVRNIFMGRELTGLFGLLDPGRERREAERLMREIGFTSKVFSPDSIVGQLSGGERQGVALARAIYNKADLIVMDEPTTRFVPHRDGKGVPLRANRARGRPLGAVHRPQHPSCLRHRRAIRRDGSRTRCAAGDEGGGRNGRAPDRLHGKTRSSRRTRVVRPGPRGVRSMSLELESGAPAAARVNRPPDGALRRLLDANRAAVGTFVVFVVMIGIFMTASPRVFLNWPIYNSVLVTLPVALCLVVPLVFIVTVGEIDLSFPATMGFSAWIFALIMQAGLPVRCWPSSPPSPRAWRSVSR